MGYSKLLPIRHLRLGCMSALPYSLTVFENRKNYLTNPRKNRYYTKIDWYCHPLVGPLSARQVRTRVRQVG